MPHYPLFLSLTNRMVLVVGAGCVGKRKLKTLLAHKPGKIVVVDPLLADTVAAQEIVQIASDLACKESEPDTLRIIAAPFAPEHIEGAFLVFAATDNAAVNSEIVSICREKSILCNRADSEEESDFIVPATIRRGPLAVALGTGGASPALAKKIRQELEITLSSGYAKLAELMGRLRPMILGLELPSDTNAAIFRSLVYSPLAELLENEDQARAMELLTTLLPEKLHSSVREVLE